MDLLKAVLLICSTTLPRAECQPDTALHVITGPEATTASLCGFQSQAYLATTTLAETLSEGTYLEIQCKRAQSTAMTPPLSPVQGMDQLE